MPATTQDFTLTMADCRHQCHHTSSETPKEKQTIENYSLLTVAALQVGGKA
jgi:hypothetical protein